MSSYEQNHTQLKDAFTKMLDGIYHLKLNGGLSPADCCVSFATCIGEHDITRSDLLVLELDGYKCSDIARKPVFTSCLNLFKRVACVTSSTERFDAGKVLENIAYFDNHNDAYGYCLEHNS